MLSKRMSSTRDAAGNSCLGRETLRGISGSAGFSQSMMVRPRMSAALRLRALAAGGKSGAESDPAPDPDFQSVLLRLAHALGGLGRAAGADLLLDPAAGFGINALPVLDRAAQHGLAHAAKQAASNLVDKLVAVFVAEDLAHQYARLGEIVIIRAERVGIPHHLAIGFP